MRRRDGRRQAIIGVAAFDTEGRRVVGSRYN